MKRIVIQGSARPAAPRPADRVTVSAGASYTIVISLERRSPAGRPRCVNGALLAAQGTIREPNRSCRWGDSNRQFTRRLAEIAGIHVARARSELWRVPLRNVRSGPAERAITSTP